MTRCFRVLVPFLASLILRVSSFYHLQNQQVRSGAKRLITSLNAQNELDRRTVLSSWTTGMILSQVLAPLEVCAVEEEPKATITDKVVMDVRISRQDGTFYVRDDLDDSPENKVFYGQLTFGLFGELAPQAVKQFLSYVDIDFNPLDDNPMPSYARSTFVSLDQSTGLLVGGFIPSLQVTDFGGSAALKYGGRVLPAPLWADNIEKAAKVKHTTKGLLTHRTLEIAPTFGITTRSAPELDDAHTVFGQLILDDSSRSFLDIVRDLPTYSMERPRRDPREETALDEVASAVFTSQRLLFRSAAKTMGDTRLDKVFPDKLLRRVEVTQVKHL